MNKNKMELQVPSITEWLIHEFHNQALVRIGADPTLVSAIDWEIWEDELGNKIYRQTFN